MNRKIGAITEDSLVCIDCANSLDNDHIITEWAWSNGYPDGYTCADCGDVFDQNGNTVNQEDKTEEKVENPGSWQKFMASVRSSNEATINVLKNLESYRIKDEPQND